MLDDESENYIEEENDKDYKQNDRNYKEKMQKYKNTYKKFILGNSDLFSIMNMIGDFMKFFNERITDHKNVSLLE